MNLIAQMFTKQIAGKQKLNRAIWYGLGIVFVLQLYFVRELLAVELLFGIGFAVLFSLGLLVYMIGRAGERGLGWVESHSGVFVNSARRGFEALEELSRKPFRHPRSESAQ